MRAAALPPALVPGATPRRHPAEARQQCIIIIIIRSVILVSYCQHTDTPQLHELGYGTHATSCIRSTTQFVHIQHTHICASWRRWIQPSGLVCRGTVWGGGVCCSGCTGWGSPPLRMRQETVCPCQGSVGGAPLSAAQPSGASDGSTIADSSVSLFWVRICGQAWVHTCACLHTSHAPAVAVQAAPVHESALANVRVRGL